MRHARFPLLLALAVIPLFACSKGVDPTSHTHQEWVAKMLNEHHLSEIPEIQEQRAVAVNTYMAKIQALPPEADGLDQNLIREQAAKDFREWIENWAQGHPEDIRRVMGDEASKQLLK